ncbi:MAG: flagellar export chaperone FliS [Ruminococcaceae bacterium]|nr:flagellar export chaperone FliS [Oscillospiraceae bacterium]MBD5116373.1 flagellar export chaperone FliS [Oscillospiraceae bacterium]
MNPYAAYKKQSVTTMTPIEIVIKLYSETERELNRSIVFIEDKNYESANKALNKSVDLIAALRSVLDVNLPIGKNLDSIYTFLERQIIAANVKKDVQVIKTLLPMIGELKDAFTQISTMSKDEIAAQSMRQPK